VIVVDASITLAWILPDEGEAFALRVLERIEQGEGLVPTLWALEVGNALLTAERRGRLRTSELSRAIRFLTDLPIRWEPASPPFELDAVLQLARTHRLTAYDAAYLELAVRSGLPLATLDEELHRAAKKLGIALE
jgi:predicted nucleic acid-binding protein